MARTGVHPEIEMHGDFTPLTDPRACTTYRSRVAGNLVIKAIAEMAGIGPGVTRIADHRVFADAAE